MHAAEAQALRKHGRHPPSALSIPRTVHGATTRRAVRPELPQGKYLLRRDEAVPLGAVPRHSTQPAAALTLVGGVMTQRRRSLPRGQHSPSAPALVVRELLAQDSRLCTGRAAATALAKEGAHERGVRSAAVRRPGVHAVGTAVAPALEQEPVHLRTAATLAKTLSCSSYGA